MTDAELLLMTKANLEIIGANTSKDTYLTQLIDSSKMMIEREGISLDTNSIEDCNLITMYASYLYRKRAEDTPVMPRMLRYALNNRLFSEKVSG